MSFDATILDHPAILSTLFYPRPARPGHSLGANVVDGTIPVEGEVVLGYRLYRHTAGAPVILFFHGNGETAPDYDAMAEEYHRAGASLLVVDYRGYGWSTGSPKVSTLLSDVEAVIGALPEVLAAADITGPHVIVMGRSLGSACAIHAAYLHPDRFQGLIIESAFADSFRLLARLGLPTEALAGIPDPIGNLDKIKTISLPLLVIHGEEDSLIHVNHGQALYEASPATYKQIVRIAHAGHNDLLFYGMNRYFSAVMEFVAQVTARGN